MKFSKEFKTWDLAFYFEQDKSGRSFIKEMDKKFDKDTLTGLNYWKFKKGFCIIGCVFQKKINFEKVNELAMLWGGHDLEIKDDNWTVDLTRKSVTSVLGNAGKLIS